MFGIELLDIRFKRINYNESVRPKIYDRFVIDVRVSTPEESVAMIPARADPAMNVSAASAEAEPAPPWTRDDQLAQLECSVGIPFFHRL